MSNSSDAMAFARLVDRWFDALYRHVSLVYPLASASTCVAAVFNDARTAMGHSAPSERAWLYGLARQTVLSAEAEPAWRQRNADAIQFAIRDVSDEIAGPAREAVDAAIAALSALPTNGQELVRLIVVEDLTDVELGWIMEISPTYVQSLRSGTVALLNDLANRSTEGRGGLDD